MLRNNYSWLLLLREGDTSNKKHYSLKPRVLLMRKHNQIVSSLPALLQPRLIIDVSTGETIPHSEFQATLNSLIQEVKTQTQTLYEEHKRDLLVGLESYLGSPQPAEYARQKDYTYDSTRLPARVKAKYRINKLIQHKLVSETASYVLNPNPRKREHSFSETINLGAVDKQMVSLSTDDRTLTLVWKCWDRELLLEFTLPEYTLKKRNITKWCLPVVSLKGFKYSYIEEKQPQLNGSQHYAGTDYGRVEPYSTIVVNEDGGLVAQYRASKRLNQVNRKRERILHHKRDNHKKLAQYEALDTLHSNPILNQKRDVLVLENKRLGGKAKRLSMTIGNQIGAELARKLAKHSTLTHITENLSWVTGARYGSKWNHSITNQAVIHALERNTTPTRYVTAKNNSQECCKCGTKIIHNPKTRTVWCKECKLCLDRDYNACLNMIRKHKRFPNLLRRIEGSDNQLNPLGWTTTRSKTPLSVIKRIKNTT